MNDVVVTVRLPRKLKEDIDLVVREGDFKNVSDLLLSGARKEVETYKPTHATLLVRKARKEIWEGYLKKAKGNSKKAADLYFADLKKLEEEDPDFLKSKTA